MDQKNISERQLVIFRIGDEEFGVDINEVREIIKIEEATKIPNTEQYVDGIINLRGKIIAVLDLAKKLGLPVKSHDKNTRIIVVEVGEASFGIVVDVCNEVIRVDGSKIEAAPEIITNKINHDFIEGVSILGERLIILFDLSKLLEEHEMRKIKEVQQKHNAPKAD